MNLPGRIESWTVKLLRWLLVWIVIVCAFGIQHISYLRQKNHLCRQLRRQESELKAITQAFRSLRADQIQRAARDPWRASNSTTVARRAPRGTASPG